MTEWDDAFERRASRGMTRGADAVFDAASMRDYGAPHVVHRSRRAPALVAAGALVVAGAGGGVLLVRQGDDRAIGTSTVAECRVFLRPDVSASQRLAMEARVRGDADLTNIVVFTQEDANAEFQERFAEKPELAASVTPAVLPPSIRGSLVEPTDDRKLAFEARYRGNPEVSEAVCLPGVDVSPAAESRFDCWITPVPGPAGDVVRVAIERHRNVVTYTYGDRSVVSTIRYQITMRDRSGTAKQSFIENMRDEPGVAEVGCEN